MRYYQCDKYPIEFVVSENIDKYFDSRKLTSATVNSGNVTPPTAPTGTAKRTPKCGARI